MTHFDFLHDPIPDFVERFLSVRLPQHLYVVAIVMSTVFGAIAVTGGVESLRIRSAESVGRRAEARLEESRLALSRAHLEREQFDDLVRRDRRLRDVRVSGSEIAALIARVGNTLPQRAWLTKMTAVRSNYALKGRATDVPAVERLLETLLREKALAQPAGNFRLSRDDAVPANALAFEIGSETPP